MSLRLSKLLIFNLMVTFLTVLLTNKVVNHEPDQLHSFPLDQAAEKYEIFWKKFRPPISPEDVQPPCFGMIVLFHHYLAVLNFTSFPRPLFPHWPP